METLITFTVLLCICWCILIMGTTYRVIRHAKKSRSGRCRISDRVIMFAAFCISVIPGGLLIAAPAWLYTVPTGTLILSLGVFALLWYLTELQWINLDRIRKAYPLKSSH